MSAADVTDAPAATQATQAEAGFATGSIQWVLRLEGLAVFALATLAYWQLGGAWWLFLVLFLWPDLSLFAFLISPRFGAITYDAVHSYLGPVMAGLILYFAGAPQWLWLATIWAAHVGLDRFFGYGLRYPFRAHVTHLGPKGRPAKPAA